VVTATDGVIVDVSIIEAEVVGVVVGFDEVVGVLEAVFSLDVEVLGAAEEEEGVDEGGDEEVDGVGVGVVLGVVLGGVVEGGSDVDGVEFSEFEGGGVVAAAPVSSELDPSDEPGKPLCCRTKIAPFPLYAEA
jgi:hypothetical protein